MQAAELGADGLLTVTNLDGKRCEVFSASDSLHQRKARRSGLFDQSA